VRIIKFYNNRNNIEGLWHFNLGFAYILPAAKKKLRRRIQKVAFAIKWEGIFIQL
jgi:hypothetical protein